MKYRSRRWIVVGLVALLTACGQPADSGFGEVANQPHDHTADASASAHAEHSGDHAAHDATVSGAVKPVLATSELVVGPNRVALGLLEDNVPIKDAAQTKLNVRFYAIDGDQATLASEEEARYYDEGLGPRGTFIVHPNFDHAGTWGMELDIQRPGQSVETQRMSLNVVEQGNAPKIGQAAPKSVTPTERDVTDLQTITSSTEPDQRLYQMTVEQAVTSGKPSLILFATPGYCQTAVCGPGVEVVSKLVDQFGDRINAVHIEVFKLPYTGEFAPTMTEWGLQSEPWLFLVDGNGTITNRFEGGITIDEIAPEIEKLVQ